MTARPGALPGRGAGPGGRAGADAGGAALPESGDRGGGAPAAENPFDPGAAALDAVVTNPFSRKLHLPGLWFQDYRRSLHNPLASGPDRIEVLTAAGQAGRRVRFSSGEAGEHAVTVEHRDGSGTRRSGPLAVRVLPSPGDGFLRVSPRNRRYLEHESGCPFFAIGENLCMYERREGTYYFDRLLEELSASGGNYARLWQEYYMPRDPAIKAAPGDFSFAGFPLETQVTGLGDTTWRPPGGWTTCRTYASAATSAGRSPLRLPPGGSPA